MKLTTRSNSIHRDFLHTTVSIAFTPIRQKSKMNPLENQTEAPKPKRGRGRPRGTKNTKKAPTQPLIIKVNTHAPVVSIHHLRETVRQY